MKETEAMSVLRSENVEFQKLESEHKRLKLFLEDINKKKHLSTEEEIEKKKIQKQKLQIKDQIAQIVKDYQ